MSHDHRRELFLEQYLLTESNIGTLENSFLMLIFVNDVGGRLSVDLKWPQWPVVGEIPCRAGNSEVSRIMNMRKNIRPYRILLGLFIALLTVSTIHAASLDTDNYARHMKIRFGGYTRGETLTNFPALVIFGSHIANFDYTQFVSNNGYDLRFVNADNTQILNYEIETWSGTNGVNSYVWVQVPELEFTTDHIWAYWGNAATAGTPASYTTNGSTWSEGYVGVWHMGEEVAGGAPNTDAYKDSSGNNYHGDDYVTATSQVGVANGGQEFDGTDDGIDCGDIEVGAWTEMTVSAFVKVATGATASANHRIVVKSESGSPEGFLLFYNSVDSWVFQALDGVSWRRGQVADATVNAFTDDAWHYLAGRMKVGSAISLYMDGRYYQQGEVFSAGSLDDSQSQEVVIGADSHVGVGSFLDPWDGNIDEVRLSNVERSISWLWASWMTVTDNTTLTIYGGVRANSALNTRRYAHSMKITFDGYDKGTLLHEFPALVIFGSHITDFDYDQFVSDDGYDLRFVNADNTQILNYEIETWSDVNGVNSYVWVQVPELQFTTNHIWAYWGSAAAASMPASYTTNGATWSDDYAGVWHMGEEVAGGEPNTDAYKDSSGNNYHGDDRVTATGQDGVANGGQAFNETNDVIDCGDIEVGEWRQMTVTAWAKATGDINAVHRIVSKDQEGVNGCFILFYNSIQQWTFQAYDPVAVAGFRPAGIADSTVNAFGDGEWHYFAGRMKAGESVNLYMDGINSDSSAVFQNWGLDDSDNEEFVIGADSDLDNGVAHGWDGNIDEVRIHKVWRSDDWLWASRKTVTENTTFADYGAVMERINLGTVIRIR